MSLRLNAWLQNDRLMKLGGQLFTRAWPQSLFQKPAGLSAVTADEARGLDSRLAGG